MGWKTRNNKPAKKARKFKPTATRRSNRRSRLKSSIRSLNIHKYSRWNNATYDTQINCSTIEAGQGVNFQLQKIVNPTEFSALYDRYMITSVIAHVQLITNPDSVVPLNSVIPPVTQQTTNWFPTFWYCPDYDDDNTPSLDDLKQRTRAKCFVMRPNRLYKIPIKPAVNVQTYATAVATGYAPKWKTWIDMAQLTVPHYGLKCVVDTNNFDPNDTYPFIVRIRYKYYFTCKDVI